MVLSLLVFRPTSPALCQSSSQQSKSWNYLVPLCKAQTFSSNLRPQTQFAWETRDSKSQRTSFLSFASLCMKWEQNVRPWNTAHAEITALPNSDKEGGKTRGFASRAKQVACWWGAVRSWLHSVAAINPCCKILCFVFIIQHRHYVALYPITKRQ